MLTNEIVKEIRKYLGRLFRISSPIKTPSPEFQLTLTIIYYVEQMDRRC